MSSPARPGTGKPVWPYGTAKEAAAASPGATRPWVASSHKNGCYNRESFPDHMLQPVGLKVAYDEYPNVTTHFAEVPYSFKKDCQYAKTDLGKADTGCKGCKWTAANNPAELGELPEES